MNMLKLTNAEILTFEQRYRAKFINALSGAKSANLLGTQDSVGNTNLSIVSSCVHIGSDPALLAMVIRPASVPRHSFENILETKTWTINHVHGGIVAAAHQTSARYPKEISEFSAVGLTPIWSDLRAPYVQEAKLRIGLSLAQHIHIAINQTELLIGKIEEVFLPKESLLADGHIDFRKLGSISVTGLDHYYELQSLARFAYAKPNSPPQTVD